MLSSSLVLVLLRFAFSLISLLLSLMPNTSLLPPDLPPEQSCSAATSITFGWLNSLVSRGWKKVVSLDELPSLSPSLDVRSNLERFREVEQGERLRHSKVSLSRVLLKSFYSPYLSGLLLWLIRLLLVTITCPILLQLIISFIGWEE